MLESSGNVIPAIMMIIMSPHFDLEFTLKDTHEDQKETAGGGERSQLQVTEWEKSKEEPEDDKIMRHLIYFFRIKTLPLSCDSSLCCNPWHVSLLGS